MAQLKDGTIVNGTITANLFDGIASTANGYSVTSLNSINLNSQSSGMYLCTNGITITDTTNSNVQLVAPVSILIEGIGSNRYMQTIADYNNNVYRRIVSYTNPSIYKWKKL